MKRLILVAVIFAGLLSLTASEAGAVVCVRGVYRAGCIGAAGAVGVRRGYYGGGAVYRGGAVVRRGGGAVYRGGAVVRRGGAYRRRF